LHLALIACWFLFFTTVIKTYNAKGIEGLEKLSYKKGSYSVLKPHETSIKELFEDKGPRTAKEARQRIFDLCEQWLSIEEVRRYMRRIGMKLLQAAYIPAKADEAKQSAFLNDILLKIIILAKLKKCQLYFMDGAHFVLAPFNARLWCFKRPTIKAAAGRNRINVLGAINGVDLNLETVINTDYINAQTVLEMLQKLRGKHPKGPIHIVLDNARYQHCDLVKAKAQSLKINLLFLPPYSPNLNLIERLWKYVRKEELANNYFETPKVFHEAIKNAMQKVNSDPKTQQELKSLMTLNFQTLHKT
jgi:transposase